MHLTISPGKQAELAQKALRKAIRFTLYAAKEAHKPDSTYCIEPLPQDNRFRDAAWQVWPFKLIYQAFLLTQQGGITPPPGLKGCHASMKTWWNLRPSRSSIWSRRRTLCSPTPLFCKPP